MRTVKGPCEVTVTREPADETTTALGVGRMTFKKRFNGTFEGVSGKMKIDVVEGKLLYTFDSALG